MTRRHPADRGQETQGVREVREARRREGQGVGRQGVLVVRRLKGQAARRRAGETRPAIRLRLIRQARRLDRLRR